MRKTIYIFCNLIFIAIFADISTPEIVIGDANFSKNENVFEIATSEKNTYIRWDNFNIAKNEIYRFLQPSETSAVLNRVINEKSNILGCLESNGKIFLLNPNGIIIGKDAKIDVNSFIASTLDLVDINSYFENKEMFLEKSLGSIINLGKIKAFGDVYLISENIQNVGSITSENGSINFAATDKVLISPNLDQKITILTDAQSSGVIDNSGKLKAPQIDLRAKNNPYALAIKHTGIIDAKSIDKKNANIYLIAENSKVSIEKDAKILANENTPTNVQILGKKVYIKDEATIDISSDSLKKYIYIGGGYQGVNPDLITSEKTFVGKKSKIIANGIDKANGGRVILWSDGITNFQGFISSKGGKEFGDGGFIEVSGLKNLIFQGKINAISPFGKIGTLLLDPSDIAISKSATSGGSFNGSSPTDTFTPTAAEANIFCDDLYAALDSANVVINTSSAQSSSGDITINTPIKYISTSASSGNLSLIASRNININGYFNITGHVSGSTLITLSAQNEIHTISPISFQNAAATFSANDIIFQGSIDLTNFDNFSLTATNDILLSEFCSYQLSFKNTSDCTITAGHDININSTFNCDGANSLNLTAPNDINVSAGNSTNTPAISFSN